jgi:hypothetical protein
MHTKKGNDQTQTVDEQSDHEGDFDENYQAVNKCVHRQQGGTKQRDRALFARRPQ